MVTLESDLLMATDQGSVYKGLKHAYKKGDLKRWFKRETTILIALCGYVPSPFSKLSDVQGASKICPKCFELAMEKKL